MVMEWQVYTDDSRALCLAQGVFPTQWLVGDGAEQSGDHAGVHVSTLSPQIVPEIEREASKLKKNGESESSFRVRASALGRQPASGSNDGEDLYCTLKIQDVSSLQPAREAMPYASWLNMKLDRADFHRQRGNDRFKRDAIAGAVRAYERALQWLACPSSQCEFSISERERVNAIAVPCHSNLATCHWKRQDMDACIRHATNALAVDASHTKARYRRSQACLQTKQFDEAVADLELVVAAEPESKLFTSSLAKAKLARQQHRTKARQALASAFQG
jgi:tetratricopeptide (TPR) repeat protein